MSKGFRESEFNEGEKILNTEDKEYGNYKHSVDDKQGEEKAEKEVQEDQESYAQEAQTACGQGREADGEAQTSCEEEKKACRQEKDSGETLRQKISEGGAQSSYGYTPPHGSGVGQTDTKSEKSNKRKRSIGIGLIAVIVSIALLITSLGGLLGMFAVDGLIWIGRTVMELGNIQIEIGVPDSNEGETLPPSDGAERSPITDGSELGILAGTGYSENMTIPQVVELVADTVVEITTTNIVTDRFYGQYVTSGAGSGVIIREDGYIVTNHHVIEDARSVTVRLTDGSEFSASYVGSDVANDIAVIKINATGLTPARGSSSELTVGQDVIAIGNPLGTLGGTVTDGIISALDRKIKVDGYEMTLMQTNAAINPGNSGGGLFNMSGELIGIVNAKQSDTGIEGLGFAIPISVVNESLEKITKGQ